MGWVEGIMVTHVEARPPRRLLHLLTSCVVGEKQVALCGPNLLHILVVRQGVTVQNKVTLFPVRLRHFGALDKVTTFNLSRTSRNATAL